MTSSPAWSPTRPPPVARAGLSAAAPRIKETPSLSHPYIAVRGRSTMSRGVAGPARIGVVLCVLVAALVGSASASAAVPVTPVCGAVPIHHARCFSLMVRNSAKPFDGLAPSGYGPADLSRRTSCRRRRPAAARRSRSSTPTTTRPPSPTSRTYRIAVTACRRAPRRTAASARSTRTAARSLPARRTPAGRGRSRSTSTWSRRSARTARSCWSRRRRTSTPTSAPR